MFIPPSLAKSHSPSHSPSRSPFLGSWIVPQTAAPAYAEASGGQARCRGGGLTGVAFSPHGGG